MENIDILKMSSIIVKTFLVFYATLITKELMIYLSLAMIALVTMVYIACSFKRIIYEVICTLIQIFMIYFIYVIDGYMTAVEYTTVILVIRTILMALLLIFTTYMLFRNIDLIAEDRVDKNIKKTEKQKDSAKGMN
jgi:phosphotransferase system  glucose/maltose/N-acetylglucosamine-specific IIC component